MPLQCIACSKVNPSDAVYCYYDGRALANGSEGPLRLGVMPFPMPFCFSDGESCKNFNQLALACDARWDESRKLLSDGIWQTFFTAMGRLDLATAAQQVAKQPDLDVGLSQLLEKFPTDPDVLRPPKLALSATQQDLGTLAPGTDKTFPLQIANQGLLVLRGMVTSDCEWLSIGQPVGQPAMRVFQTRANHTLTVKVLGHKLRAGRKPLEGTIVVDTNGGNTTVVVRAQVPIRPFPKGANGNNVLAGAMSPHELAVKAKAHPLEAATLFEQGAVRAWYASNGWAYPIQGTEGVGKGAVQQFFEALGLVKAPRLEISAQQISCKGKPGQRLTKQITISTQENRPVYANAWSNQDWIKAAPAKPQGNKITIPLQIEVPQRPGETVNASVTFQGNGNQQFVVPVSLMVAAAAQDEEEEEAAESGGGLKIGWLVAAIVVMIAITAGVVGIIIKGHEKADGPPVVVVDPKPPLKPPDPPIKPPDKSGAPWWDKMSGAGLTSSLAALREIVPQEKDLLDGIADSSDLKRYKAYDSLKDKLPVLLGNAKARDPLGQVLVDCCVFEPEERNVSPLAQALTSQLPSERAEFRPEEKGDELKRALWSFNTIFSAMMHKAIQRDRVGTLARQLGSVLGLELNTAAPPGELKKQATELLAKLCYRGTLPTAAKSVEHALLMRDDLLKEFPGQLPLGDRAKIDVDVVARALAKSGAAFPRLQPILKDCLENGDLTTSFKILELYERAKPELAPKIEGLLSTKWKVLANPKLLTQADKAIALRKFLSNVAPKIAPAERLALMQKLASGALASTKAIPKKDLVYLQDTLKLAHASAMAAAFFHKETGPERFDELAARAPEIEQPEPEKTEDKKPDKTPDKPDKTKPAPAKGGTIGVQPKVYNGQLTPVSPRDPRRGGFCDIYSFNLQAGQLYTIDHMSRAFDAYLRLEDPRGFTIAEDDDSGGSLNSRITFQAPMNGSYRVFATSLGGRGTGPYTLMIRRGAGGFGPGFGRPIRRLPGLGFPGLPVPGLPMPGQPGLPGEDEPKDKGKNESQLSVTDLVTLEKNKQRSARVEALERIAGSVSNDMAPRHARRLARYLLGVQGNELDEIAPKLESFAKCRQLILALADQVDKSEGPQKTAEKVVGDIVGQNLQFDRDEDWRTASRRILMQRALDLGAPAATNVAEQAAEILRELYKEQGYAFGMEEGELASCSRPAQVLGAVMKYVAAKAAKDGAAPEHKETLERAGRYVQAAEFVADNDLEQLIVMQRIWLRVLSIYLEKSVPAYGKRMSELQQELVLRDRRAAGLLDQLRAGEEKALRIWALANNLKS